MVEKVILVNYVICKDKEKNEEQTNFSDYRVIIEAVFKNHKHPKVL